MGLRDEALAALRKLERESAQSQADWERQRAAQDAAEQTNAVRGAQEKLRKVLGVRTRPSDWTVVYVPPDPGGKDYMPSPAHYDARTTVEGVTVWYRSRLDSLAGEYGRLLNNKADFGRLILLHEKGE